MLRQILERQLLHSLLHTQAEERPHLNRQPARVTSTKRIEIESHSRLLYHGKQPLSLDRVAGRFVGMGAFEWCKRNTYQLRQDTAEEDRFLRSTDRENEKMMIKVKSRQAKRRLLIHTICVFFGRGRVFVFCLYPFYVFKYPLYGNVSVRPFSYEKDRIPPVRIYCGGGYAAKEAHEGEAN